jgi:hypothetical protein
MDADQVFASYLDGIRAINPAFDLSWVRQKWLFKDPGGQPVITTNYSQSIPDMRTGIEGLYLANTTQVYPEDRGQNYSLLLGEKVAALMDQDARAVPDAPAHGYSFNLVSQCLKICRQPEILLERLISFPRSRERGRGEGPKAADRTPVSQLSPRSHLGASPGWWGRGLQAWPLAGNQGGDVLVEFG